MTAPPLLVYGIAARSIADRDVMGPLARPAPELLARLKSDGLAIVVHVETTRTLTVSHAAIITLRTAELGTAPFDADGAALEVLIPDTITRSAPRRRRTFLAGRASAALALEAIREPPRAPDQPFLLPIAPHGGPDWPEGLRGSLTHTSHSAAAIVARTTCYRGLGIDIEDIMPVAQAEGIAPMIAPELLAGLVRGVPRDAPLGETLTAIFSAKECLFKCLRPLVDDFFDFTDASMLALDLLRMTGRVRLTRQLGPDVPAGLEFDVQFHRDANTIHSALCWPV